ncbi:hypothetical protein GGI07_003585 [Coemansia sp. Benny D115]|nr:hypothetical protein GGI07_003585 [Coemansia sp. Benny D115]
MQSSRLIRSTSSGVRYMQTRQFHQQTVVSKSIFSKFFGKKEEAGTEEASESNKPTDKELFAEKYRQKQLEKHLSHPGPVQLKFPKRSFTPERLEYRVRKILRTCEVPVNVSDWKTTSLEDKAVKLKVLSAVMQYIKLEVTNRALNNIRTVGDLVEELKVKPVNVDAGHVVAQFFKESEENIPANMKFEPYDKKTRNIHARQ